MKLRNQLSEFFQNYSFWLVAVFSFAVLIPFNAARYEYPMGFAGLYAQAIEEVLKANWHLPQEIAHYGQGGIPFAYPPLAFYVGALATGPIGIDMMNYLAWAPAVFTSISAVLLYFALARAFDIKTHALLGTWLSYLGLNAYSLHVNAGGAVRALALLLAHATLFSIAKLGANKKGNWSRWIIAGILLGLTGLTHPSYAAYAAILATAYLLLATNEPIVSKIGSLFLIAFTAFIASSPWWLTVILRHGFETFGAASGTHGTLPVWQQAAGNLLHIPVRIGSYIPNLVKNWEPQLLAGLGFAGLAYLLVTGQSWIPLGLLVVVSIVGESTRFVELLGGGAAGYLLAEVMPLKNENRGLNLRGLWKPILFYGLVIGSVYYQVGKSVYSSHPDLNSELIQASRWIQVNTPPDSSILLLSDRQAEAEWVPYLAQRQSPIGHWGTEWTGDYRQQQNLQGNLGACLDQESIKCLNTLINSLVHKPGYLVINEEDLNLLGAGDAELQLSEAYQSERYVVYELAK